MPEAITTYNISPTDWTKVSSRVSAVALSIHMLRGDLLFAIAPSKPAVDTDAFELLDKRQVTTEVRGIPSGQNLYVKASERGAGVISARPLVDNGQTVLGDGANVTQIGSTTKKWVDDFGGSALDTTLWDVNHVVAGHTVTVTNSELRILMPTTNGAEVHLLSKEMFTIPFDLYMTAKISQRIAGNEINFELVEVDPETGIPVPHAVTAGEWRNRATIRFAGTSTSTAILEATCDDSSLSNIVTNSTQQTTTNDFDLNLELRPADTLLSTFATDTAAPRNGTPLRLSKQVPDPNKVYKLRLRFRNTATAASPTTITIYRALVCDIQELVVELSSGRGDSSPAKGVPVNVASMSALVAGTAVAGGFIPTQAAGPVAGTSVNKIIAAASTNATSVKAAAGKLIGGNLYNNTTNDCFLKFFNKATAPVPGTDTPVLTFVIPNKGALNVAQALGDAGYSFTTGIGFAITGAAADADATAVVAGQAVGTLIYA